MTSEGKLYRKIHNLFVLFVKATDTKIPLFVNLPEAVKGYLDEAKQDWKNNITPKLDIHPMLVPTPTADALNEIMVWFEKWFGGSEK
jgi:hypothetical protein